METVPFNSSLRRRGDDVVPHQMAEVNWTFRVSRRVEDITSAAVPREVSIEILLYDADHGHRSLAARRLRILHQFAVDDGPLDVQNLVLPVVIVPPQAFQFFRPQTGKCEHDESGLGG